MVPKCPLEVLITVVLVVEKADAVSWVFRDEKWGAYPLTKNADGVGVVTVRCDHKASLVCIVPMRLVVVTGINTSVN